MADQLKTARVTGATLGSELPARIGELEAALSAITGIPLDVLIASPMHEVVAAGLTKVLFKDSASDPATIGALARNGAALKWFDGITAKALVDVLVKQQTEIGAANTAVETSLISEIVPAGTLGINGVVHGSGNLFISSILPGASCQVRLYFNVQGVLFATIVNNSGVQLFSIPVRFDFRIHARNSTTVLMASAGLSISPVNALLNVATVTPGSFQTLNVIGLTGNTAINMAMQVNVIWSSASPSNAINAFGFDMFAVK